MSERRKIRGYLADLELEQKVFAQELGISLWHLSHILAGRRRPSAPLAVRMAQVLRRRQKEIDVEKLLSEFDPALAGTA